MSKIDKNILDLNKAKIEPIAKDEIFVQVKDTLNYWISNYARLTNNLRGYYYLHKEGNVHWTITTFYNNEKGIRDCYPCELVAQHFLEKVKDKHKIWHIDGDRENNYYKNLIYVDGQEKYNLSVGKIDIFILGRQQEYIPYIKANKNKAYLIYNGILKRCFDDETKEMYPHYEAATMYSGWKEDPELFVEWYEANYYEVDGESMAVDKDLLYRGNKEYHPQKCVIIPQGLNTMLSNCKKHYFKEDSLLTRKNNNLPLGVFFDKARNKYYGQIKIDDSLIKLSYWDTKDDAFEEYKKHKEAHILIMADRYKNKIPKHIYDALLKIRVDPY